MKLLHTADLHIGKSVHEFSLLEDQKHILGQILTIAEEEDVDGLIVAGDIYDRPVPASEAVVVLDSFLNQLEDKGIAVFMITGNHDSPERLSFANKILEQKGVHISGSYEKPMHRAVMSDEYGNVNIYLLPFIKPQVMRYHMQDNGITTYQDGVLAAIRSVQLNETERNVLLTHHFITNQGLEPEQSDSEQLISVGGIHNVDVSVFEGFDYVALGHIHSSQSIKNSHIRYSGSPLKYSFSEVNRDKSVTIIDLRDKGEIDVRKRELVPLRDMRRVKGNLIDLMKEEIYSQADVNDYLQVTLTDKTELFEPMQKLRSVYPNVMQLITEKNELAATREIIVQNHIKSRSALDTFREFYENTAGLEFDKSKEKVITEILEQIGGGEV